MTNMKTAREDSRSLATMSTGLLEAIPGTMVFSTDYKMQFEVADRLSETIIQYMLDNIGGLEIRDYVERSEKGITVKGSPDLESFSIIISELSDEVIKVRFEAHPYNKEGETRCWRYWDMLKSEEDFYRTFNSILFKEVI